METAELDEFAWLQMCHGVIDWDVSNIDDDILYSSATTSDNGTLSWNNSTVNYTMDGCAVSGNTPSFISPLTSLTSGGGGGRSSARRSFDPEHIDDSMSQFFVDLEVTTTTTPLMDTSSCPSYEKKVMLKSYIVNLPMNPTAEYDFTCGAYRGKR
jgi:hypothetical protein